MPAGRKTDPAAASVRLVAGTLALSFTLAAQASRVIYLARDALLCDRAQITCVNATLTYAVNERLLWLRGRVQSAPGAGMLQIMLRGSNRLGHVRYAPMEVALRGNATEIVDFRMIPDYPDVANWEIDGILFMPLPQE